MKYCTTLLCMFWAFCAFGQARDKYDVFVDSLESIGQEAQLIPYFQQEVAAHPQSESALRWLGFLYITTDQLDLGEKYYRQALAVNPQCARCYLHIGRIYARRNDFKMALEYFDKSVNADPADASLYANRADLKKVMGDKSGVLVDLNTAIELDPKNADYFITRGMCNSDQGYFLLAVSDFNNAVKLTPKNYYPYFQRASVYYGQKMFKEALKDINTAIQLDSNEFALYNGRGAILSAMHEPEKAIADYTKAIKLNPEEYAAYYNRASERYSVEDLDGACSDIYACYKLLRENDPANALTKELELSIADYCDSTQANYYYQRGIAHYNLQQFAQSIGVYTRGLKKFPDNAMTLSFRGNAYYALQDYKNALPDYYSALKNKENVLADVQKNARFKDASASVIHTYIDGFWASVQICIAESKFALGQYEQALPEINKALAIAPQIKDFAPENIYHVRGNIWLALGNYRQAIADFDTCIRLNPDFVWAYINRAVVKISQLDEIKVRSYAIKGGINDQTFNANWSFPLQTAAKKSVDALAAALADCDKAIAINHKSDYAYYIRGQIKKVFAYPDYCYDLIKAKELGYPVAPELLADCRK